MDGMGKGRAKILVQTLKKIPLFHGLSSSQIQQVLVVCQPRRFDAHKTLCATGTPPDEMYILLSGSLGVVTEDGSLVAALSPVTTVGEMGIVTHQVRRATVATLEASNVLVIRRTAFEAVLSEDKALEARIYRNIVQILADKIVQDNVRTREYLVEKVRQQECIREARRRADLALELVVSEAGMDRARAQAIIDEGIDREPRLRVLIVDDEADMRHMLCDALADYDTSEARDGEEALEEIGDDPPDLVITDIRMPGMDGYALVKRLEERSPETPVLAISGYVSDADIVDYEFDAFLEKPMNLKEFRDFVDVALTEENQW
jgi:CheY-like chemotaxis protein